MDKLVEKHVGSLYYLNRDDSYDTDNLDHLAEYTIGGNGEQLLFDSIREVSIMLELLLLFIRPQSSLFASLMHRVYDMLDKSVLNQRVSQILVDIHEDATKKLLLIEQDIIQKRERYKAYEHPIVLLSLITLQIRKYRNAAKSQQDSYYYVNATQQKYFGVLSILSCTSSNNF